MKIAVISAKKSLKFAVIIIIALIAVFLLSSGGEKIVSTISNNKKLPIYCVDKADKVISISFDAAWGNEDTEKLIEILDKYNIKATFFVVGAWVDKYPESVKALSDAGHEVESHSDTHPHMASLSREQIEEEISSSCEKIRNVTGKSPTLFRAPYGEYCNFLIEVLESRNMYCIQWDVDSLDWKELSAQEISSRVVQNTKSGSIVLFHNAALHTPEALPTIIESLQSQGYKFVKISELIMTDNYEIDYNGKQIEKSVEKKEKNLENT